MKKEKKIIILGGGPTGIGAAYHLKKLGHTNWVLYEQHDYVGGHSATHLDEQGFLWDEGGHVLFSHFPYYDKFVDEMLGKDLYRHERESWVKLPDAWVPYPFQNNIHRLPAVDQLRAIVGLLNVQGVSAKTTKTFKDWVYAVFGEGIAELFMIPYNFKVWATPADRMSKDWIGERVSVVDVERILGNIVHKRDDISWGPNNTFIFPKYGGTKEIYHRAGQQLQERIKTKKKAIAIDLKHKTVRFEDGSQDTYDALISALPIDRLLTMTKGASRTVVNQAQKLLHNSIVVLGVGIKKKITTSKCWVYFPDKDAPFYRLTYFHNYSPYVVPQGDTEQYSSLMLEVSYSSFKKINKKTLMEDTLQALVSHGIIDQDDLAKVVSKTTYDIEYGYPIPSIDRDSILKKVQPYLMKNQIYSRGRYGAWKYEISNMDHCFMQGVEAVEHIIKGKKESVWS